MLLWVAGVFLILGSAADSYSQEIEFGRFGNFTITLENISLGDLTFEDPVLSNGGIYRVELIDSYVLSIIGVKYLDVGVELVGDGELLLDGDPANAGDPQRSIPFTLRAAYANNGQNNISDAVFRKQYWKCQVSHTQPPIAAAGPAAHSSYRTV